MLQLNFYFPYYILSFVDSAHAHTNLVITDKIITKDFILYNSEQRIVTAAFPSLQISSNTQTWNKIRYKLHYTAFQYSNGGIKNYTIISLFI